MDNNEYFSLNGFNDDSSGSRGTPPSSEYHSDGPVIGDSGTYSSFHSTSSFSSTASNSRKGFYDKAPAPPPPGVTASNNQPKAIVVFDYVKKANSKEVTLDKSQIVTVLESKPGSDWWRVQDSIGRKGFYPSHYLKMI